MIHRSHSYFLWTCWSKPYKNKSQLLKQREREFPNLSLFAFIRRASSCFASSANVTSIIIPHLGLDFISVHSTQREISNHPLAAVQKDESQGRNGTCFSPLTLEYLSKVPGRTYLFSGPILLW